MKFLNESKININLATPLEKYKQVNARYSFSASKKHFIVEIKSTSSSVGTEILYVYNNMSNFNVKLHFHTSLIMATNILLVGKISPDMVRKQRKTKVKWIRKNNKFINNLFLFFLRSI